MSRALNIDGRAAFDQIGGVQFPAPGDILCVASLPPAPMRLRRLLVVLLLPLTARPALTQLPDDYYKGTIVSNQVPDRKITLELRVIGRDSTSTTAVVRAGAPLDFTSLAWIEAAEDSLYIVVATSTDTIVLASNTRTGAIGGDYWVSSGRNPGVGGTWRLEPAPRLSVTTLVIITTVIAAGLIWGLFSVATRYAARWWSWRERQPFLVTAPERKRFSRIGGWLLWLAIGQGVLALVLAARYAEIPDDFASTWMLAGAVQGLRVQLIIESSAHVFQFGAIIGGLVLLTRRSQLTPLYWILVLGTMATYGAYDIAATQLMLPHLAELLGPEATASFQGDASNALVQNGRLVFWALVWMSYWMKSRRVALVFGGDRFAATPEPPGPVKTDYTLPLPAQDQPHQAQ